MSLRDFWERSRLPYRLDQFDEGAREIKKEFGAFEDTQRRDEFLHFGCVLENWQEYLVCLLGGLCTRRQKSVIVDEIDENLLLTSSRNGREAYSACGDKSPSFISA